MTLKEAVKLLAILFMVVGSGIFFLLALSWWLVGQGE